MKSKRFELRLTKQDDQALEQVAKIWGVSKAEVIRRLIKEIAIKFGIEKKDE